MTICNFRTALATTGLLLSLGAPLVALQIEQYQPGRHLRFEEGTFPAAPQPNSGLWANDLIFNGVGWSPDDTRQGFALISPRHFIGANHFPPAVGSQIRFFATDGQLRSYTFSKFYNIENPNGENTDIFIGELSADIPASHAVPLYPVLDAPESELIGRDLIVYGRGEPGPRIGRGVIGTFNDSFGNAVLSSPLNDTRNYTFQYVESFANQDDAYAEIGDSGSPSFILADGMLTVSGTHSAILQTSPPLTGTTTTTYDSFLFHYKNQIDAHLSATGHRLIVAPLGETGLAVSAVERNNDEIILQVHNPADLPYDVERTTELTGQDWEVIATSQTGSSWTGEIPAESNRLFWRLMHYPLPVSHQP